jgi:uncharacterized protein YbjT (DUF2867 family)
MTNHQTTALVTGATGFVGRRLALALRDQDVHVRCLVRDREKARELERAGCELHEGDLLRPETLEGAADGVDIAYYLVHSMGRGSSGAFADRDREAASAFARLAREAGVGRIAYLGGLGDAEDTSEHLRSRHEVGRILEESGPPLTYFRAAMVVGAESESYRTLLYLVRRLPVMVTPSWLETRTQPIGVDDVIAYLVQASDPDLAPVGEVQIGGPDVLPYSEMLDRMAAALDKRPPVKVRVPLLAPGLSSKWIGLVTPVDADVARPLVEGLRTETVVTDPSAARRFDVEPTPFDAALRSAVAAGS